MAAPRRGEIWYGNLDPQRGREQAGSRPVLVISTDDFNAGPAELVVVLPITSKRKGIPWHVPVRAGEGGLKVTSEIMVDAVRSISKERLTKRMGAIGAEAMRNVELRLRILLEL